MFCFYLFFVRIVIRDNTKHQYIVKFHFAGNVYFMMSI